MKLFKKFLCMTLACLMVTCCFTSCDWLPFFGDDKKPDDNNANDQNNSTGDATGDGSQEEENKWDEDSPRKSKTYEVLFIGNSYTKNGEAIVYNEFKSMAESAGYTVNVDYVVKGAYNLEAFANINDEYGKKVDDKLWAKKYDYVILQEQSHRAITNPASFYKGVRELVEKIRYCGAEPILYCTWGREHDSTDIEKFGLISNEAMTYNLAAAYTAIAEELDVEVVYVGFAHYDIYNNTDITIYIGDANTHQNKTGAYLSALTLFCDIFNVNVEEVTYEISIPANQIAKLKAAAGKAAFDPPTIPEEYKTTPTPVN